MSPPQKQGMFLLFCPLLEERRRASRCKDANVTIKKLRIKKDDEYIAI